MAVQAIIVKIGGKIFEDQENLNSTITQLRELIKRNIVKNIIIIPGGGTIANFIRKNDATLNMGDDLAHWSAILAMHYNGLEISKKYSDIDYIIDFNLLQNLINDNESKQILVFGPFNYLSKEDILPHSWEVTSDSITLFLAYKLKLDVCYLIKDVDGILIEGKKLPITEISVNDYKKLLEMNKLAKIENQTTDLKESQPIDSYILKLIDEYKIPCIILNGTKGKLNILSYFDSSKNYEKIYTKIRYD